MNKFTATKGLTFDDVLIVPKYSSIKSRSTICTTNGVIKMPLIPANMDTITGLHMWYNIAEAGGWGILHRYMSIAELKNCIAAACDHKLNGGLFVSVGALENDKNRINTVLDFNDSQFIPINFCIDIAHGDSEGCVDTISYIRDRTDEDQINIIAGNVATAFGARRLFKAGADVVKVGIGPGSVCSTRIKTGVGVPQLTAILDCAPEGRIIADGGFKYIGDVIKALAAHPNVIGCMSGSLFAGTHLTPGWKGEGNTMEYRGMASKEAQFTFKGKFANAEGVSTTITGKEDGSTFAVINEFLEGLRSAMSYVGCSNIMDFANSCQFIEVSSHTSMENIPHFGVHKK